LGIQNRLGDKSKAVHNLIGKAVYFRLPGSTLIPVETKESFHYVPLKVSGLAEM
jgi:hypothetical protein